ncbi:hypothetical protein Pmani_011079 [Petrolisthes manimaculis]|uniref:Uncharacterized protein n=1 Tax=Petrolisthes manimaculis TaxID=1843537 RepID=A0AAE1UG07_9EUCA|nr:hypothetical protein Pmani_011079 [Petrolisthes manimaculis]
MVEAYGITESIFPRDTEEMTHPGPANGHRFSATPHQGYTVHTGIVTEAQHYNTWLRIDDSECVAAKLNDICMKNG